MNRMAMSSFVILLLGAASCGGNESHAKAPEPPPPTSTASTTPPSSTSTASTTTAQEREGQQGSTLASSNTGMSGSSTPSTRSSGTPNDDRGTTAASTAGSGGSAQSNAPMAMSDDQILYTLHAANMAEMEQARVAQKKAQNARVKRFASMMLKDHGEADSKGNDVAKKMNASLSPSEVSNRLETEAKQVTAHISAENAGKDFDRSYINGQVKEHRAVLDAIDRELLPSAKSSDVKELLQTVRPKIEGHLREAEDIQKGLGSK